MVAAEQRPNRGDASVLETLISGRTCIHELSTSHVPRGTQLNHNTLLAAGIRSLQESQRTDTILFKCLEMMKECKTFYQADEQSKVAVAIVEAMLACIADGRSVTRGRADMMRPLADMLIEGSTTRVPRAREVAHRFMERYSSSERKPNTHHRP